MSHQYCRSLKWLSVAAIFCLTSSATAVERTIKIEAAPRAVAGSECTVVLSAATNAGQGERIGLLQVDYSLDGGQTWIGLCYLNNIEAVTRQDRNITAGPAGSTIQVRMRVAFRDGLAGDVAYTGAAILWAGTWEEWREPPATSVTIAVVAKL
jgi:hypothetical protein